MVSNTVRAEDLLPVRSRIAWGPIFAGAAIALAVFFLLTLLGGAIGVSVGDRVRAEHLSTGAAIWAILTTVIALFVGGYFTSQFSVGENKTEAVLYGLIMWALMFVSLLWMMAMGVRAGFNAMVGMATVGDAVAETTTFKQLEDAARRANLSQEDINKLREQLASSPQTAQLALADPQNRQELLDASREVAWWTFAGTLLSMLAAAGGALLGAGPSFRLVAIEIPAREVYEGRQTTVHQP
jgi:hypothetical protein